MNCIADFFQIWIKDILLYPYHLYKLKKIKRADITSQRKEIKNDIIYIGIHEWGGYPQVREKKVKNVKPFVCGLKYQLERFKKDKVQFPINLTITMSDIEKYKDAESLKSLCDNFISVPNLGMDFSGYSAFFNSIRNKDNAYVILTNTSINEKIDCFLLDYINYMEKNKDVGILGISCSSKYYHTLVRNNFNPHLQSFFLLTTIDVLRQIVELNNGEFPGVKQANKHLLIRNGEVKLSRLALELGYNLAIVNENGETVKFNYKSYPMPKGDLRIKSKFPNRINPIK